MCIFIHIIDAINMMRTILQYATLLIGRVCEFFFSIQNLTIDRIWGISMLWATLL